MSASEVFLDNRKGISFWRRRSIRIVATSLHDEVGIEFVFLGRRVVHCCGAIAEPEEISKGTKASFISVAPCTMSMERYFEDDSYCIGIVHWNQTFVG